MGSSYAGTPTPVTFQVIYDRWVEVRLQIDLDADSIQVFYDGQPLANAFSYSLGYMGSGMGTKDIAGIHFEHLSTSAGQFAYWDDVHVSKSFPPPTVFCTAKTGLVCGVPSISASGTPSVSASSGFTITAAPARACKSGVLLYNVIALAPPHAFPRRLAVYVPFGLETRGLHELPGNSGSSQL